MDIFKIMIAIRMFALFGFTFSGVYSVANGGDQEYKITDLPEGGFRVEQTIFINYNILNTYEGDREKLMLAFQFPLFIAGMEKCVESPFYGCYLKNLSVLQSSKIAQRNGVGKYKVIVVEVQGISRLGSLGIRRPWAKFDSSRNGKEKNSQGHLRYINRICDRPGSGGNLSMNGKELGDFNRIIYMTRVKQISPNFLNGDETTGYMQYQNHGQEQVLLVRDLPSLETIEPGRCVHFEVGVLQQ